MNIGIGYYQGHNALEAGQAVIRQALQQGQIANPNLVLAFCNGELDAEQFFQGIRVVIEDDVPIVGGSTIGIITNEVISYAGPVAGALVLEEQNILYSIAAIGGIDADPYHAGQALAQQLGTPPDDALLLLFYDSIKIPATDTSPPIMNASPSLILGIEDFWDQPVPIIGAGVIGDYAFQATSQFCGHTVAHQHVVGVLLSGAFRPYSRIMHGCVPMDGVYHTITRMAGAEIYEIDGEPVIKQIDRLYGSQEWRAQFPVKRLALGVNMGEPYIDFQEEQYLNRLITGALPDGQGIGLFEPDLEEGTQIQYMLRDSDEMIASAVRNTKVLLEQIRARNQVPMCGIYIDCAGRTAVESETLAEEAAEVQTLCNQFNVPLFGVYSGVEIAPFLGRSRGLDWTGVLLVLAKDATP